MTFLRSTWSGCRWCIHGVASLLLWTLWLLLAALLALQLIVWFSKELRVPTLVIRSLESKLAVSGLRVTFDSASFDTSGHVLIENLRIYSDGFQEPLATCASTMLDLDPRFLFIGTFEVQGVTCFGANFYVPAMVSPSGKSEPVLQQANIRLGVDGRAVVIREFSGRVGNLAVAAHGGLTLPRKRGSALEAQAALSRAVSQYVQGARRLAEWEVYLEPVDTPSLFLDFRPHEENIAWVSAELNARGAEFAKNPLTGQKFASKVRLGATSLRTLLPLKASGPFVADVTIHSERGAGGPVSARDVDATVGLSVSSAPMRVTPRNSSVSVASLQIQDLTFDHLLAHALPQADLDNWYVDADTRLGGETWSGEARGNFKKGAAAIDVSGKIFRPHLELVGKRIKRDLNALLQPEAPADLRVSARFDPGWKLTSARGRLDSGKVVAHNVALERAAADFVYNGTSVYATDIVLDQGESIARGSYWMDTRSLEFRFLLAGKLRPTGISGWFGPWWSRFWTNFEFTSAAPAADVDVQGRWRDHDHTTVFIYVDAPKPQIRGVDFDRVRTTLFIRPEFYDGLEIAADRESGHARGRFTRIIDREKPGFISLDFNVTSNIDLQQSGRLFGPEGEDLVMPFKFERAPLLTLAGRLEGDASPNGKHEHVDLQVNSSGPFTFFDFPLSDLVTRAKVNDEELYLGELRFGFAQGAVDARARVSGRSKEKRLSFDGELKGSKLGEAIRVLEAFGAQRRGEAPPPVSRFQQRAATGTLDLKASASGLFSDPYSYVGKGTAEVRGAELAEINLLGALSAALHGNSLLGFTSWSLDTARANFSIEKDKLVMPELTITGPSAKLEAHGQYALQAKTMAFNAKFYPYEQGKTLLANAVDLVLTPVSAVLELKLAGSLDKPKWYFTYGPTNFFKKLSGAEAPKTEQTEEAQKPNRPPMLLRR